MLDKANNFKRCQGQFKKKRFLKIGHIKCVWSSKKRIITYLLNGRN